MSPALQDSFVTTGPRGKPQLRTWRWGWQLSASHLSPTDGVLTSPCEPQGRSLGLLVTVTGAPPLLEACTGRLSSAQSPPLPPSPPDGPSCHPCLSVSGASMLTHRLCFSRDPAVEVGMGGALDYSQTCVHYSLQPTLKQHLFSKEYISEMVKITQLSQATPASPRTASALKEGSWSSLSLVEAGTLGQWGGRACEGPHPGPSASAPSQERPTLTRLLARLLLHPSAISTLAALSQCWGHKAQRGAGQSSDPRLQRLARSSS